MHAASTLRSFLLEKKSCLIAEINKTAETNQNAPKKTYAMAEVLELRRTRIAPSPSHPTRI